MNRVSHVFCQTGTWNVENENLGFKKGELRHDKQGGQSLTPHIFAVATPFLFFPFVSLSEDPCASRNRCSCAVSGFLKQSSLKPLH